MAIKFPKFSLGNMDVKTRMLVLVGGVIVVIVAVVLGLRLMGGGGSASGPSRVATAPSSLQSVPGGQLSPEYYRALMQANVQASQQAKITGTSAISTLVNPGGQGTNCTVVCPSEDNPDVTNDINNLVQQGKLTQADANRLLDLAKNNATPEEYAAELDRLVKEGKLTPEQARQLLEKYKKQHDNALLAESGKVMDGMIRSGQMSLGTANELLALQKKHVTPAEYAAELDRLVREGKLTPAAAAALLAQYTQQHAKELAKKGIFGLQQMAKAGEITPEVAKELSDLQNKDVPVDQYAAELDRLVKEGKLTPAAAAKLLAQYKNQKTGFAVKACMDKLTNKTAATETQTQRLLSMYGNNASLDEYTTELKKAVQAGTITPDVAMCLLQEYQAKPIAGQAAPPIAAVTGNVEGAAEFAALQQRVQQQTAAETTGPTGGPTAAQQQEFQKAAEAAAEAEAAARAERVQALETAMSGQAGQLISAWQPVTMVHRSGSFELKTVESRLLGPGGEVGPGGGPGGPEGVAIKPALIKAGTIYFGILETAVDSDYPDTPVMVTIIEGPMKGARLLGKLSLAQGQDRVSLSFSMMNKEEWLTSKPVTAFAIDPDTARTVLATSVNHHYLLRFGSMFAASFLQGYAQAISQSGATTSTGIFGTTTTHPNLSAGSKIAVGLGQVGTAFSGIVANYVNTPTTVRVRSGVGLGILFMTDVPV